jgi:hypothetical protein
VTAPSSGESYELRFRNGICQHCAPRVLREPVRHRQTKGAAKDMFDLQLPRHISALREAPAADNRRAVEAQIRSLLSDPLRLGMQPSLTLYWL